MSKYTAKVTGNGRIKLPQEIYDRIEDERVFVQIPHSKSRNIYILPYSNIVSTVRVLNQKVVSPDKVDKFTLDILLGKHLIQGELYEVSKVNNRTITFGRSKAKKLGITYKALPLIDMQNHFVLRVA